MRSFPVDLSNLPLAINALRVSGEEQAHALGVGSLLVLVQQILCKAK
jgi:hypothetical protein